MLEQIKQKVQTIANNSNKQIIIGVYQNMITSHNEFCGCNYCIILLEYVKMKKRLSFNKKNMNNLDNPGDYFFNDEDEIEQIIKKMNEKILELKHKKNELKII